MVDPQMKKNYKKIFQVELVKEKFDIDFGIYFKGGWNKGEWISVSGIAENSPAFRLGSDVIRIDDSLVQINDQLTFFMSLEDVQHFLNQSGSKVQLTFERGCLRPLSSEESNVGCTNARNLKVNDTITLIVDKDRGIFAKN